MEELIFVDRKNTNSVKWDGQTEMFGTEGLHAMWVADMDIKAPACVRKALADYVELGAIGYYKIPDSYYEAFLSWEKVHHGFEGKKEWMRFSPGVVAAFNWLIQMMSQPGDAVIVNTPVYYPFLHAVTDNGRKLITSELINENGIYRIDYEDFENKIIEHQVKVFILCSPHNPVGRVWSKDELKKILEICQRHDVFVISDEIHQDMTFYGHKHTPSFLAADDWSNIVTLTAASKTFNLAGGQHAIALIPDEALRKKWDDFTLKIRLMNGNAFGYIATEAAYSEGEEWYQNVRKQVQENDTYLRDTLKKFLPDLVISPLEGTYLVWIDLRAYMDPKDVKPFIMERCKLAVDFGDWFGGEQFEGFIRMNLATSKENVKIGIERMIEFMKWRFM